MKRFSFLTFNTNGIVGAARHHPEALRAPFEKFSFAHRLSSIMETVRKANANVVCLFELSPDFVPQVKKELKAMSYTNISVMSYSPNVSTESSDGKVVSSAAFLQYVTGVKDVEFVGNFPIWFTSTPTIPLTPKTRAEESVLIECGDIYEKGSSINIVKDGNRLYICAATHSSVKVPYQFRSHEILLRAINSLERFYSERCPELEIICIIGGDLNTQLRCQRFTAAFREEGYQKMLKCFFDDGFVRPLLEDGKEDTMPTFRAYPNDLGIAFNEDQRKLITGCKEWSLKHYDGTEESKIAIRAKHINTTLQLYGGPLETQLDHLLIRSKINVNARRIPLIKFGNFEEQVNGIPTTISDHLPMMIEVE